MRDSTHLKAHRTAASLSKGGASAGDRTHEGRAELKAPHDQRRSGAALTLFLSPGPMNDARGALALLTELPAAKRILGDHGHDADWLREELKGRGLRIMLFSLYEDRKRSSSDVRAIAERHLARIDEKIVELQAASATLRDLVMRCHGDDRPDWPIMNDLATSGTA